MLATLAPRSHRQGCRGGDRRSGAAVRLPRRAHRASFERSAGRGRAAICGLTDAVIVRSEPLRGNRARASMTIQPIDDLRVRDSGYLDAFPETVSGALARLPAALAITEVAQRIASLGGQAQTRMHAASQLGTGQVEEWARREAEGTGLEWRELLAGAASSVLVLHALIAAAADPRTTGAEAEEIASAYLYMCVPLTLLDGLVDHEEDRGPRQIRATRVGLDRPARGGRARLHRPLPGSRGALAGARRRDPASRPAGAGAAQRPAPRDHARRRRRLLRLRPGRPGRARRADRQAPAGRARAPDLTHARADARLAAGQADAGGNRRAPRSGELASFSDKSRFIDKSRGKWRVQ